MAFWAYVLILLLPALVVSIALALLPIRRRGLLTVWTAVHVLVSALLIWLLPSYVGWVMALAPGMVLAAIRLVRVLATGRTSL